MSFCRCGHADIDHHLTGYLKSRGKEGRGRCSFNSPQLQQMEQDRCACVAYDPEP